MSDHFTTSNVFEAAQRVAQAFIANTDRFNKLDAAGGDGDMGSTLAIVSRALLADGDVDPGDVGASLMHVARIIARTSGSSLSVVMMMGLTDLAKTWTARPEIAWVDLSSALGNAVETIQSRSGAMLGDKTVIDALARIAEATKGATTAKHAGVAARDAAAETLETYRDRPVAIGRLRLEPSGGVGIDDPGMVALQVAVAAMAHNDLASATMEPIHE